MWSPYNKYLEYYYYPHFTDEDVVIKMLKTIQLICGRARTGIQTSSPRADW